MSFKEWKETTLGELVKFQRGHDLSKSEFVKGSIPIAGSNGVIGFHNKYTCKAPCITIGRSGNIGTPHFYNENIWAHNTTLFIKEFYDSDPRFVYYLLHLIDLKQFNSGSAVPSLNRNYIHPIKVFVPLKKATQQIIGKILSCLDDKIELNRQTNKTLEAIAQTLFKEMCVPKGEELPEGWKASTMGEIFELQRGYDLPASTRTDGKYPVIAASGFNGYHNAYKNQSPGVTTGRSGVLGNVFYIQQPFWALNTSLFVKNFKIGHPIFTYFLLKTIALKNYNGGSAVPTLNRNDVHKIDVIIPPLFNINKFSAIAKDIFELIDSNEKEIQSLINIRDSLLPKLMKGEIEIKQWMKC